MSFSEIPPVLFTVWCMGVGGALLAVAGLLVENSRARRYGRIVSATFMIGLVAAAVVLGVSSEPEAIVYPVATLAGICALAWAAHFALIRQWALRLLDPRVIWGFLLIVGPSIAFCLTRELNQPDDTVDSIAGAAVETSVVRDRWAITDAGRIIQLYSYSVACPDSQLEKAKRLREMEAAYLDDNEASPQVVRTAGPSDRYNCHGWVFTGGRFAIASTHVDDILSDNGYREVSRPKAGDVIVYRDENGEVLHSGLVRFVVDKAIVLVESKWGPLGRYLHTADSQPYGRNYSYFRVQRVGHELLVERENDEGN